MYERRETRDYIYFGDRVMVSRPERDYLGTMRLSTVNWSAIGHCTPEEAKVFHKTLGLAIVEAEKLNEEVTNAQ